MQTFLDSLPLAKNKQLDKINENFDNLHPISQAEAGTAGGATCQE
jgi:hypothetical protein